MRKNVLFLMGFMLMTFVLFAGKTPTNSNVAHVHNGIQHCTTKMPNEQWENAFQQQIQEFVASHNSATSRIAVNYTIPVIVHIVYYTTAQNIPQSQVTSQINTLNADYAGTGYNVGTCPAAFQSLISNTGISFCLAAKDPNGNILAEPGIDRVSAVTKGFTNPGSGWSETYIDANIKPNTIWDPTKYMNIWVLPISGGILGYATFPAGTGLTGLSGFGTATTDGVVINTPNFGTSGAANAPYNLGRTASHEIGHWLGLRHISGDSNCGEDYCGDTPVQSGNANDGQGLNYGCPTFPSVTCSNGPNGDMFMDFMDYTDDACMYMFTPNQSTRMQTAMANGTYRKFLNASTCNAGPAAPIANFSANRTTVCVGNTVTFTDLSSNTPTSWSWSFTGGTPATSTAQNPTITYNSVGSFAVSLTATNSLGSNTMTQTAYITVVNSTGSALPLTEGFQNTTFPPTGWSLASQSGFNWARSTAAGGYGTSTASALFDNFHNDATGMKDDMITPTLSISNVTNPKVKFDYAYAYFTDNTGSYYDSLQILVYDFCANTYTSIYKKGGAALATAPTTSSSFVPTSTQWKSDSVAIPITFLNKNVKIIFRNISDYAQNLYVDNINIYGTPATTALTASFTSSADSVCKGGSLTFTSTSTGGPFDSIRWTFPNGTPATSTVTNPTVAFNTAGTITVTLKVYKSGSSSTSTKTIVVKSLPTVVANGLAICSGNTASITATGATSYSWNTGATGATLTVSPTATTTYTVTGTTNGCSNTDTAIITVKPKPTVVANGSAICAGNSATITASGATTYSWNTGATGATLTVSPTATTTYTVTGTTNGCSNTDTAIITVNPKPTVVANGSTICAGNSATITATGATTYSWNTGATGATLTVSPTATTTYTVTGTTNGCSNTDTAIITVNPKPTVVANGSAICAGNSATITASGATTYAWNTGATGATVTVSPTATTTYTVTGTTNGCSNTDTAIITVNPKPTVVVTPLTLCSGQTGTLTASGATTYSWNTGATTAAITVSPTTTTTYTVTGTSNGCSNTVSTTVSVSSAPNVILNVASTNICSGSSYTFTASGANNYTWSTGATGSQVTITPTASGTISVTGTLTGCTTTSTASASYTVVPKPTVIANGSAICAGSSATITASGATSYSWNTGATTASITVTPTTTTTYTVTGTTNGCTNTDTAIITVNPKPTVVANGSAICAGSSATISASGATSYSWNTGATGATLTVSPTATTTYTVTGTTNGCSNTDTAIITVNPKPTVVANGSAICSGNSATISANGATSYSWSTGATGTTLTVSPTATTTYTVTGTTNGCSNTDTAIITVNPKPTVVANSSAICAGNSATITASGATTYSWNTGATGVTLTVSPTATTTYTVTGSANGCSSTAIATITVNPLPSVAISPLSLCSGQSGTLTASGASSYSWNTGATTASISISPTSTTTYTVTGTSNGCSKTVSTTVSVSTAPTVTLNATNVTICNGDSYTFVASGANAYTWSTGASGNQVTISPTSSGTISVTGTLTGCATSSSASTGYTVNPKPTVAVDKPNASICSGSPVTITASGATTYAWNTGATSASITVNPSTTTSYTVTGTTNGCSNSANSSITVNSTPAQATISQNTGSDTIYSSTVVSGATYNWYLNGSTTAIQTSTPYLVITQNGNYTVQVVSNGCASTLSSVFSAVILGIKNNSNIVSFQIIPNPNSGNFNIQIQSSKNEKFNYRIFNVSGQVLLEDEINIRVGLNTKTISMNGYEKGMYFISLINNDGIATQTILLQ